MSAIGQFKPQATAEDNQPPSKADSDEKLERSYWQGLGIKPPLYGADVAGSLCDADLKVGRNCHLVIAAFDNSSHSSTESRPEHELTSSWLPGLEPSTLEHTSEQNTRGQGM